MNLKDTIAKMTITTVLAIYICGVIAYSVISFCLHVYKSAQGTFSSRYTFENWMLLQIFAPLWPIFVLLSPFMGITYVLERNYNSLVTMIRNFKNKRS